MLLLPPKSTLTGTLFPYSALYRCHEPSRGPLAGDRGLRAPDRRRRPVLVPPPRPVDVRDQRPRRLLDRQHAATPVQRVRPGDGPLGPAARRGLVHARSEEHTSELQSLMRTSYALLCLNKTNK